MHRLQTPAQDPRQFDVRLAGQVKLLGGNASENAQYDQQMPR
jgi:hypothetical protein